jgi:hypothetical protein
VISYSKTSFAGLPQFFSDDAELDSSIFGGADITQRDTPLGELATVSLEDLVTVDGPLRAFTLLVPKTRLSMGDEVFFDTLGIETIGSAVRFVPSAPRVVPTYRSPCGICGVGDNTRLSVRDIRNRSPGRRFAYPGTTKELELTIICADPRS